MAGDRIIITNILFEPKSRHLNRLCLFKEGFLRFLLFRNASHGIHSENAVCPRRKGVNGGFEPLPRQSRTETDCSDDVIGRLMLERLHAGRELQTVAVLHGSGLFSGPGGTREPNSRHHHVHCSTFGCMQVLVFSRDNKKKSSRFARRGCRTASVLNQSLFLSEYVAMLSNYLQRKHPRLVFDHI